MDASEEKTYKSPLLLSDHTENEQVSNEEEAHSVPAHSAHVVPLGLDGELFVAALLVHRRRARRRAGLPQAAAALRVRRGRRRVGGRVVVEVGAAVLVLRVVLVPVRPLVPVLVAYLPAARAGHMRALPGELADKQSGGRGHSGRIQRHRLPIPAASRYSARFERPRKCQRFSRRLYRLKSTRRRG